MMNAQLLYKAVLAELRKNNTGSMSPEEFNYHVKVGQIEYVKTQYAIFERHQKLIDDLQKIVKITDGKNGNPNPLVNKGSDEPGLEYFDLPVADTKGYMFTLQMLFQLKYRNHPTCNDDVLSDYQTAKFRAFNIRKGNVYDTPDDGNLFYTIADDRILPIAGNQKGVVTKAIITYLRYPQEILLNETTGAAVSDCEFNERTALEIAKWTTHSFLETIESIRLQTMEAIQGKTFINQISK